MLRRRMVCSGGLIHTFSGWLLHGEKGEDMLET